MASEILQKFAEELRTAREAKGISILQISSRTKIDPKFLSAIENADFEILPELYVRAFIKEFAQTIDLNPKEIIQKFDLAKSGQTERQPTKEHVVQHALQKEESQEKHEVKEENSITKAANVQQSREFDSTQTAQKLPRDENPKNFLQSNLNIIIGVSVVIVAVLIFYFAIFYESSPAIITDQQEQTDIDNTERFEVKKHEPAPLQDSIMTTPNISDSLRLSVQNSEQVWVKVVTDGRIVQQGVLLKNTTLNFKALKQFGVSVGNAGVIKLFFNDKPVKNVGKPGEIRNITLTPDTIRYLTIPRNEKKSPTRN
jgi:cytoskeletal protein RodZ